MPDSIARMSGSTEKWHTTGVAGDATRNKSHCFPIQKEEKNKNDRIRRYFCRLGFCANSGVSRKVSKRRSYSLGTSRMIDFEFYG